MGRRELDWADRFSARWGYLVVVPIGRLFRQFALFIALPAGIARISRPISSLYNFFGSLAVVFLR